MSLKVTQQRTANLHTHTSSYDHSSLIPDELSEFILATPKSKRLRLENSFSSQAKPNDIILFPSALEKLKLFFPLISN